MSNIVKFSFQRTLKQVVAENSAKRKAKTRKLKAEIEELKRKIEAFKSQTIVSDRQPTNADFFKAYRKGDRIQ